MQSACGGVHKLCCLHADNICHAVYMLTAYGMLFACKVPGDSVPTPCALCMQTVCGTLWHMSCCLHAKCMLVVYLPCVSMPVVVTTAPFA